MKNLPDPITTNPCFLSTSILNAVFLFIVLKKKGYISIIMIMKMKLHNLVFDLMVFDVNYWKLN